MVDREHEDGFRPEDDLRDLWQQLDTHGEPPADALTTASVEWAQRAWNSLETPAMPAIPVRRHERLPLKRVAAAALIAIAVGASMWSSSPTSPGGGGPIDQRESPVANESDETHDTVPAGPTLSAARPDGGIELKSGPVRLVLVHASVPGTGEADTERDRKETP